MSGQGSVTGEFNDEFSGEPFLDSIGLNGDDHPDILTTGVVGEGSEVFATASVFLNNGNGTFGDPVTFGFYNPAQDGSGPQSAPTLVTDADGNVYLLAQDEYDSNYVLLKDDGTGKFVLNDTPLSDLVPLAARSLTPVPGETLTVNQDFTITVSPEAGSTS